VFSQWLYRALVFVISCPCALVISIPLGILVELVQLKNGILFKGSNFLDVIAVFKM
jgi:Cd2+/Zn2+-exporting ATPase